MAHLITQQGNPPQTAVDFTISSLPAPIVTSTGAEKLAVDQANGNQIITVTMTLNQALALISGTNTSGVPTTSGTVSLYNTQVSSATTGTIAIALAGITETTVTPTGAITYNATSGINGQETVFVITTSGASSFNITFGTNFKSTGVLATGTVTGKVFTVSFIYDGVNWNELGRTVAM